MADNERRERDLILAPNEYAFILDETKGNVVNYVGPHKTSLANTDQPVVFNDRSKRFERCLLEKAIQAFAIAPEGWYVMLKNPAKDGKPPTPGTANSLPPLDIGRKVNIPGPVAFAPWPGQMVRVIQGHHLRSNQYLIVRVYDEEAARANWSEAVIKPQTSSQDSPETVDNSAPTETPELTMGKLLVIKGTEVSFYIPPTGVEVVPESSDRYVRDAVTLERLEYCILLDEDGNKRFITGPSVVFPHPTETFVRQHDAIKFKAIELNEIRGLYLKVIAPYEENGQKYQVGDELFITGKEQMIYFPRPEHAIIRYGDREVNYAVAIPAGEARYVLDRNTGQISLQCGPCMFLPDPRREVIARRVLDPKQVEIWFPGNQEALEYNRRLQELMQRDRASEFIGDQDVREYLKQREEAGNLMAAASPPQAEFAGDNITRRQRFTRPRTVTLDTKYEGAVAIDVWTGYAVMVVSKRGERKVIVGPQTCLLEYDETLQTILLSSGTPKNDNTLLKTVYLRVLHNKVSDRIEVETRDLCQVSLHLSYRVNFEGDPNRWFEVENYIKFLTDHLRSLLRHAVKQYGIEEFYAGSVSIIRDAILGTADSATVRKGMLFPENGMHIYDVEVLDVAIQDARIAELLVNAQHRVVQQTLEIAAEKRNLELLKQREDLRQEQERIIAATEQLKLDLSIAETEKRQQLTLTQLQAEIATTNCRQQAQLEQQQALSAINEAELARQHAQQQQLMAFQEQRLAQELKQLEAEINAVVAKAGAISPQLIAALQAFADKALAERLADSMAPLAILGGRSIAEVFAQLVKGTQLEQVLSQLRE